MGKNILIIAGEPSGDIRAGELLRELKDLEGGAHFWGIGGDSLAGEGMELVEHIRDHSMVGVVEIVSKLPKIFSQINNIKKEIEKRKPDFAILVDYPGFNLKIARILKKNKVPVVYYIVPQVWAWGEHRIKTIKKCVSLALVLFPFEEKLLSERGVKCRFVGHPLVDTSGSLQEEASPGKDTGKFTIALLPGSRKHEISHMLPIMLSAAEKIKKAKGGVKFILAESSNINKSSYEGHLMGHEDLDITSLRDDTLRALRVCDFALVTSGTATLEAAIAEAPMIIVYKASLLSFILYKIFANVTFLGLANIIAGKEIVPELLQANLTTDNLSKCALEIINSPSKMNDMKVNLRKVKEALGEKGAAKRAAEAVKSFSDSLITS